MCRNKRRGLGRFWTQVCLTVALASAGIPSALASPSDALIVVGADSSSSIADQLNTRLAITSALQNLSSLYSSTDVLSQSDLTASELASAIRKRSGAAHVDLLVLSREPGIAPSALHPAPRFRNLRLVYVAGESSLALASEWKRAGAALSIAQSDFTRSSSLSSERFIFRWAQGWSAEDAARDAASYATATLNALQNAAEIEEQQGLSMTGRNLDQAGRDFGTVSSSQTAQSSGYVWAPPRAQDGLRSPFQKAAVAAGAVALVPAVTIDPSQVRGAQNFLTLAEPLAWAQLQNLFFSGQSELPAVNAGPMAQEIWVDGGFLQYIAAPLQKFLGGKFSDAMKYLQGLKLDRTASHLEISIYFSQAFDVQLKDPASVSNFQLYAIHIPKTVRVAITGADGSLRLDGLDAAEGLNEDHIFLEVKIPATSTKVYLRDASVDLTSGDLLADAGILGDSVGLVAGAKIFAAQVQPKLDFWRSVEQDLPLFAWPLLTFSPSNL